MEKDFLDLCSEIGNNFNLVQGSGGNTSHKQENYLHVKASGYKLKNSLKQNIFVKVNLNIILQNLKKRKKNPLDGAWDERKGIRPSIETTMHAILPQKYIFHIHCLNSLSWLVQKDFEKEFSKIFKDYNYCVLKYSKPGLSLTREIEEIKKLFIPDIVFLSNHGVVIGANKLNEARNLIYFVSNTLKPKIICEYKKRKNPINEFFNLINFRPIKFKKAHNIAYNPKSIEIITFGSIFPDQVVYLGPDPFLVIKESEFDDSILRQYDLNIRPKILIIPKLGIFVPNNISDYAEELVYALSIIVSNIPKNATINFLDKEHVNELVNWDSEIYRFNLNNN